jgi:hypothetical protein
MFLKKVFLNAFYSKPLVFLRTVAPVRHFNDIPISAKPDISHYEKLKKGTIYPLYNVILAGLHTLANLLRNSFPI